MDEDGADGPDTEELILQRFAKARIRPTPSAKAAYAAGEAAAPGSRSRFWSSCLQIPTTSGVQEAADRCLAQASPGREVVRSVIPAAALRRRPGPQPGHGHPARGGRRGHALDDRPAQGRRPGHAHLRLGHPGHRPRTCMAVAGRCARSCSRTRRSTSAIKPR